MNALVSIAAILLCLMAVLLLSIATAGVLESVFGIAIMTRPGFEGRFHWVLLGWGFVAVALIARWLVILDRETQ